MFNVFCIDNQLNTKVMRRAIFTVTFLVTIFVNLQAQTSKDEMNKAWKVNMIKIIFCEMIPLYFYKLLEY